MEVRFRPRDQYCKPASSKTTVGSKLILKIKRKVVKSAAEEPDAAKDEPKYEYSSQLIGICNKTYQFSGKKQGYKPVMKTGGSSNLLSCYVYQLASRGRHYKPEAVKVL